MTWDLELEDEHDDNDEDDRSGTIKRLILYLHQYEPEFKLPTKLYVQCTAIVFADKEFTELYMEVNGTKLLHGDGSNYYWACDLHDVSQVKEELDSEGSLNLKVIADFYVNSDGIAEILPLQEEDDKAKGDVQSTVLQSFKNSKDILLEQVGSLLGDEVTSDIVVCVHDVENGNVQIGKFHYHSAILKGKLNVSKQRPFLSSSELNIKYIYISYFLIDCRSEFNAAGNDVRVK